MKTMRCFLAFKLSLETAENIAGAQQSLKARCASAGMSVRWVPPPNIHMTVQFLGEITDPMATALKDMLEPVVFGFESFDLTAMGMGAFPDVSSPRVIWAGLGPGADTLTTFHAAIRSRLETAGFNFDKKPFAAHITVGRVKSSPPGALTACFGDEASRSFGTTQVRQLHCFQSTLSRTGAEYNTLWVLPLQKAAPKSLRQPAPPEEVPPPPPATPEPENGPGVLEPKPITEKGDN